MSVKKVAEAFKRYAKSFNIKIVDKKDPLVQLYSSKPCIKDLFKELLLEMKGLKYQITINVTVKKKKVDDSTEYADVYFNSLFKIVINDNFEHLIGKSFEEILYRVDNWINEGSGWVIETVNSQNLNVSM